MFVDYTTASPRAHWRLRNVITAVDTILGLPKPPLPKTRKRETQGDPHRDSNRDTRRPAAPSASKRSSRERPGRAVRRRSAPSPRTKRRGQGA
jgi:hypothetical protein